MKQSIYSRILSTSVAICAMWLGMGSLIFPLRLGAESGGLVLTAFWGFAIVGILFPVLSMLTAIAFSGDYLAYFSRLGKLPGKIVIFFAMLIIGPLVVMPRTIALSYALCLPLIPTMAQWQFSIIFCVLSFLLAYKPGKLMELMGTIFGPIKLLSLVLLIVLGLWIAPFISSTQPYAWNFFAHAFMEGYQTLDTIVLVFLGALVVQLFTGYAEKPEHLSKTDATRISMVAGSIAGIFSGAIFFGMIILGSLYGNGLCGCCEGELFRQIVLRIAGSHGAIVFALLVLLISLTSIVSLVVITASYARDLFKHKISYISAIIGILVICTIIASFDLSTILRYSRPFINFFCPLIIVTTVCNLLYKGLGFTWIKLPVFLTALVSAWLAFF